MSDTHKRHRLIVVITDDHHNYLKEQKEKHNLSMSAQIRSMITLKIEGQSFTITDEYRVTRSRTVTPKTPHVKQLVDVNKEILSNPLFLKQRERNK